MTDSSTYTPPQVWTWENKSGGKFANINRPVSGATREKSLPVGEHDIQLYSQGTPNGMKVTIMLEELLDKGMSEADYDAWLINISEGDQFTSGFVEINPNSKIPAMVDHSLPTPQRVFESGSILIYLAEKFQVFLPEKLEDRTECLSWLFWQVGSAPYVGGGFGHFYNYAPEKIAYAINRFTMETKRQLDVLDKALHHREFIAGSEYTIADMAIWPWYGRLALGELYHASTFLSVDEYPNLQRWSHQLAERRGIKRGILVNQSGASSHGVSERHSAKDIDEII